MIRGPNNHQEIVQLEHQPSKRTKMRPNDVPAKENKLNDKATKNAEKKKKKKKKGSGLAFWFCMGSKSDNVEKESKPYPAPKNKSKGKNESKEQKKDEERKSRDKEKQTENKRRNRHSAPPSEWISMMAEFGSDCENGPGSKNNQRPSRSQSPPLAGVRYRFDGTLEKPYVYPGGLTFKGEPKKKVKKPSKRGSKKGGNITQADVHSEDEQDGFCYESDEYDDADVRKQFYLRYDSHIRKKSSRRSRRYSMPAELHRPGPADSPGPVYGQGELKWVARSQQNENEVFDDPYESESEENRKNFIGSAQPSNYYSPPLQFSECVYMWHSCEDLPQCDVQYHSEDEIKRSTEQLYQPDLNDERVAITHDTSNGQNVTQDSPSHGRDELRHSSNSHQHSPQQDHPVQTLHNEFGSKEQLYAKNMKNTKPGDNPFKRNLGRSSCMPGNKRFFVPPPPTYTPPRDELELARGKIAAFEGHKENVGIEAGKMLVESDRDRFSRGSQTDLTDEWKDDVVAMVDRDHNIVGENQDNIHSKFQEAPTEISTDMVMTYVEPIKDSLGNMTSKTNKQKNANCVDEKNSKTPTKSRSLDIPDKSIVKKGNDHEEEVDEYEDDDVMYQNFKPAATGSTMDRDDPSRHSSRSQNAVTSTPKAKRRTAVGLKRPVPSPRQRFSSVLEYSSTNFTLSLDNPPQPDQQSQQMQKQQEPQLRKQQKHQHVSENIKDIATGSDKPQHSSVVSESVILPSKQIVKPVAKERRSRLLSNSDTSYTCADIEEGLKNVDEEYYNPSTNDDRDGKNTRRELFSKNDRGWNNNCKPVIDEVHHQRNSSSSSINSNPGSNNNMDHRRCHKISNNNNNNISNNNNKETNNNSEKGSLPPLKTLKLASSPTSTRRPLSGVFSSSAECLVSPLAKSYYSGLSSSLADLPLHIEHSLSSHPVPFDIPPFDDDDHDDENADDEMSVYNEESPLPRTPSLEDLLRARSILDRSQAVARKRRQRMRDRKCRSQILSSTEVDAYINNGGKDTRRRHSRHSSKSKHPATTNSVSLAITPPTIATSQATTTTSNAFSFDHPVTVTAPVQSRRALHKQHRLLNHTDSGMDSDGASPLHSRDFQNPARLDNEFSPSVKRFGISHMDWTAGNSFDGGMRNQKHRKSWEDRVFEKIGLKKSRSKEFLAHSHTSHHLSKRIPVSNGFETLV